MITIKNPVIWADVPDNDVIRVGNAFYMVSTSMHSMPGGPIMRSYDLQNWEIVSYMFDTLSDEPKNRLENGQNIYGQGSWAASLRKVGDRFYCLFNSNDDKCAYMMSTDNIEASNWEKHRLSRFMHDPGILLDDDGKKYVLYGNNDIYITELTDDLLDIKKGGMDRLLFTTEKENIGLKAEGCHAYKINGMYYAIFIEWPVSGHQRRREVCYRWKSFDGPFEHRVILDDDMGYHNAGVAQGAIFTLPGEAGYERLIYNGSETMLTKGPDGNVWMAVMFQDHGAVGRIPYVLPVEWSDGWPMPGAYGKVPERFSLAAGTGENKPGLTVTGKTENVLPACMRAEERYRKPNSTEGTILARSDDFIRRKGAERALTDNEHLWQWNHNPDNRAWSLTERAGYLRLTNLQLSAKGVITARNTLTQRTFGPQCSFTTCVDISGLKSGDSAGLVLLQGQFGMVGVRKEKVTALGAETLSHDSDSLRIVMCVNDGNYGEKVIASEPVPGDITAVYLHAECDFADNHDIALFSYSFDGSSFNRIGEKLEMKYTLDHFMGYRVGLYSYPTVSTGGYADFSFFTVQ